MKFKNQRLKKIILKVAGNPNHLTFWISKFCSMFISMKADAFQNETLHGLLLKHQSGFTEHAMAVISPFKDILKHGTLHHTCFKKGGLTGDKINHTS